MFTGLIVVVAVNLLADAAKLLQVANIGLLAAFNTIGSDWTLMSEASRVAIAGGDPYAGSGFMWTPLGAIAFYPVSVLGWHVWQVGHLAGALAMPTWRMRIAVLLAFPFWWDVELGNVLVFVLLAAVWALRGNPIGIGLFLTLTVLIPRPLMAPIAVWLLWQRPQWRLPFAVMAAGAVMITAGMGLLGPFIARALEAADVQSHFYNFAPSRQFGGAWLLVALPLAIWLTWIRRLGLASVFAMPYWLPYYLLIGLVDADGSRPALHRSRGGPAIARRHLGSLQ